VGCHSKQLSTSVIFALFQHKNLWYSSTQNKALKIALKIRRTSVAFLFRPSADEVPKLWNSTNSWRLHQFIEIDVTNMMFKAKYHGVAQRMWKHSSQGQEYWSHQTSSTSWTESVTNFRRTMENNTIIVELGLIARQQPSYRMWREPLAGCMQSSSTGVYIWLSSLVMNK